MADESKRTVSTVKMVLNKNFGSERVKIKTLCSFQTRKKRVLVIANLRESGSTLKKKNFSYITHMYVFFFLQRYIFTCQNISSYPLMVIVTQSQNYD